MSTLLKYPHTPLKEFSGPQDFSGTNNLGIYATESTQRYDFGTRFLGWDGSVFKYSKTGAAITNTQLAVHVTATEAVAGIETIAAAASIGDTTLTINEAGITENQLVGGYVVIFPAGGSAMVRSIVSNTASTSAGVVILTLDWPLDTVLTTSDNYEVYASPFASVSQANTSGTLAFLGMPNVSAASSAFLWIKTWGPIFIAPQSGVGAAYVKTGYFRHDGSIDVRANIGDHVTDQIAGHCLVGSASGDGPLFMLTVGI
ncbi:MAG: hypothetical protein M0R06_03370 [Sphaerochaeta sp.]|jgi:hypothetical protein|nr:hypothetical protein [Sphaerochaeta sp.]